MHDDEIKEYLLEAFKEHVEGALEDILESETLIISMYLLKYLYDRDEKYWNTFIDKFSKLNFREQVQVLMNASVNLKEQDKSLQNDKQKIKKYNQNSKKKKNK